MTLVGVSWPWDKRPEWTEGDLVVQDAIRDILLTRNGERKMNNSFGSQLIAIIFENKGRVLDALATREITLALADQLPVIKVENIDIQYPDNDNEPIDIVIYYEYLGQKDDTTVSVSREAV